MNNKLTVILLVPLALFSFLFYIFWSYPLSILAQELSITDYDFFNKLVILSFFIAILWLIIAIGIKNKKWNSKNIDYFSLYIKITCVILIMPLMYRFILPFKLSYFQDSITLMPSVNPLEFSKYYYLLDIVIIAISIMLSNILVNKSLVKHFMILLTIFYITEIGLTIISVKIDKKENSSTIIISTNKKNVIVFLFDAMSPDFIYNSITNKSTSALQDWSKDFTFYDNVTSLGLAGSMVSISSLFGGYEYTPHKHMLQLVKENITISQAKEEIQNYPVPSIYDATYIMAGRGIQSIKNTLSNIAEVNMVSAHNRLTETNTQFIFSPILAVSLYQISPYILRFIYFNKHESAWNHRWFLTYKWSNQEKNKFTVFKETEYGMFNFTHNRGTHYAFMYTNQRGDIMYGNKTDSVYTNIIEATLVSSIIIKEIIQELKDREIYDNTKIIVTSDHGLPEYDEYLYLFPEKKKLYSNTMFLNKVVELPVFFLIKDFNTTQNKITVDSRFLSLADFPGIVIQSFTNNPNYIDYTKVLPPKRIFNIVPWYYTQFAKVLGMEINWGAKADVVSNSYITNKTNVQYLQISNIINPAFAIREYPINKLNELPSFEIIQ